MQNIIPILGNILFLTLMGLGFFLVERNKNALGEWPSQVLHGVGFGLIGFLVSSNPVTLGDGATIDARAGPMVLAGFVAGPIGGLIAACLGSAGRGMVGGSFAYSGILVFFVYALIGLALRQTRFVVPTLKARTRTILVLTAGSFAGATVMFFFIRPLARALSWLQNDLPYIFIANALSVTFSVLILSLVCSYLKKSAEVIGLNQTLELAKRAGKFGVWDYDLKSGILRWDSRSREIHGVPTDEFKGTFDDWVRSVHPDDLAVAHRSFQDAVSGNGSAYSAEYRVILPSGEHRIIKGDAIVVRSRNGEATRVVGTNLDLTELRRTEEELDEARTIAARAQKFESIGQLTGGVAHDFNNLLAVIMGNQELLKDQVNAGRLDAEDATKLIDASIAATKRGAELTRNMLAYARKARLDPVLTDVNEIVKETENLVRRTIESRIQIKTELQDDLWPTQIDKASLQSTLVNLLLNARDAFDGSGLVRIETSNILIGPDQASNGDEYVRPGRYTMLAVSDNGSGMAPDMVEKIFDPFFTTKPVGLGSGLGLSMVQGFVKQSGGAINVRSEIGVGTRFELYFPADREPIGPVADSPAPTERGTASRTASDKRILLVEDQEAVLDVLKRNLRSAGYHVVTATSGDAAFAIFQEDPHFDVVVTDIVMPGELQGPSLASSIRAVRSDVPFVFLSGYAKESLEHGNGSRPEDVRLMKPVVREELLQAVEDALACTKVQSEPTA